MRLNKKGVTLVELLGAITLSGIALGLIAMILTSFVIGMNAIYASGAANTRGILLTTEVLSSLNNFAADDVEACEIGELCDFVFYKKYDRIGNSVITLDPMRELHFVVNRDGDNPRLFYGEPGNLREIKIEGFSFVSIDIEFDDQFTPLKTLTFRFVISDGKSDYEFVASYMLTKND